MKAHWIALACCLSLPALAETEHPLLAGYAAQARQENPNFAGFSADPRQPGKTPAHRKVDPLAPAANPERFTDLKKVEKWFRRNCDDVYARECTAQEKGDFISWIDSIK